VGAEPVLAVAAAAVAESYKRMAAGAGDMTGSRRHRSSQRRSSVVLAEVKVLVEADQELAVGDNWTVRSQHKDWNHRGQEQMLVARVHSCLRRSSRAATQQARRQMHLDCQDR
jgi:hypothetical protein